MPFLKLRGLLDVLRLLVLLGVLSRGAGLLVVLLVVLRLDVLLGILSGWARYRDAGLLLVLDYNAGLLVAICFYSPVAGLRWRVPFLPLRVLLVVLSGWARYRGAAALVCSGGGGGSGWARYRGAATLVCSGGRWRWWWRWRQRKSCVALSLSQKGKASPQRFLHVPCRRCSEAQDDVGGNVWHHLMD